MAIDPAKREAFRAVLQKMIDDGAPDSVIQEATTKFKAKYEAGGPSMGMGDVKMAESQAEPAPEAPAEMGWLDKLSRLQPSLKPLAIGAQKGLQFAGNLATALSTGPVNAIAQGIQDEAGFGGTMTNVARAVADPFIPGESPIQSTETTLERSGVSNEPRVITERIPGFVYKTWARSGMQGLTPTDAEGVRDDEFIERQRTQPGRAKELGFVADASSPLYGIAAIRALGAAARASLASRAGKPIREAANTIQTTLGTGLEDVGKSQMDRVIKPLMRHERKSRKPIEEVIFEQGLDKGPGGAGPKAIYDRSTSKLNELGAQLKAEIKAGRDGGARINTDQLIDDVVAEFKANPGESEDFFTLAEDLDDVAAEFKRRAASANGKGELDLLQGHAFKKYMGHLGAWQQIAKNKGIPLTAKESSQSKIAEAIYHKLNDAIDAGAPNGIKELNRQISEIIPVNQAAGWRQVIESRGNALKLDDVIGMTATALNPKVWPLLVLNRATKSGTVASKIYRLGEAMKAGKPSAKAKSIWGLLQKPLDETKKARLVQLLEAELGAQAPANAIPLKKVAEEDDSDTSTISMRSK